MRARRAATCLAAARSAMAGDRLAEAIERLEEACSLDPGAAEARLLLEELQRQDSSLGSEDESRPTPRPTPRPTHAAGWSHWVAAILAIGALAALAFLWPQTRPHGTEGTPAHRTVPAPLPADAPAAATFHPAEDMLPLAPVGTTGGESSQPSDPASERVPAAPQQVAQADAPAARPPVVTESLPFESAPPASDDRSASGSRNAQPATSVLPSPANPGSMAPVPAPTFSDPHGALTRQPPAAADALTGVDTTPVMAEDLTRRVPAEAISSASLSAPAATTREDAAEASLWPAADPTREVGETLRRYADAYSRLDAAAARQVWPTVNERALARAFEGLASQGLAFDQCDVQVQGAEATAACRGRAQYVPKVGSREVVTERRLWTFRLRKADSGWLIQQAEAK